MTTHTTQDITSSRIAWGRIAIAALLSELGVIAVLSVTIVAIMAIAPGMSDAQFSVLGEQVGYYVAPAAGAVTTFLAVVWAVRRRSSGFLTHGVLVGVGSVILTVGFMVGARPEHYVMYLVAFALRLLAGAVAGVVSGWRFDKAKVAGRSQAGQIA